MNELKIFQNTNFGELGVMTIDGKEYFPATQCAKILGYTNPKKAIKDHCNEDGVTKRSLADGLGRMQETNFISEGNLYRLIVRSKLPAAEKFERWVFDEVLPSLRKNGSYIPNLEGMITQIVTKVVGEAIKQFIPLISSTVIKEEQETIRETRPKRRSIHKYPGIISKLDKSLRLEVEDMILSERYTYKEIQDYLFEQGIILSKTAIWRYTKRLYNQLSE